MARAKEDLSRLSLNQLETLTGATHRTIKKYLAESGLQPLETTDNSIFYDPREALPIIFNGLGYKIKKTGPITPATPEEEAAAAKVLDPFIQRARKDRAHADKAEFELEVLRRKYLLASEIKTVWSNILTNFRAKLMGMGAAEAPTLAGIGDPKEMRSKIDALMRDALEELSEYDPESDIEAGEDFRDDEGDSSGGDVESGASDEYDGIGMGSEV